MAGRKDLVVAAVARLTAPGIGLDAGCVDGQTLRLMFQGLYLAPMVGDGMGWGGGNAGGGAAVAAGATARSLPRAVLGSTWHLPCKARVVGL